MKRIVWIIIACGLTVFQAAGQDDYVSPAGQADSTQTKVPFSERLVFGGGVGLAFSPQFFAQATPQVGYKTTDRWINGIGVNYMYFSGAFGSQSIYGGSVWTRFFVLDQLYVAGEFEVLNRQVYIPNVGWGRDNIPIGMIGLGYFASDGSAAGFGIQIMFDVIDDPNSPYRNPIIRGGLLFGL